MTTTGCITDTIELDARSADGIDVRLCWNRMTHSVTVRVVDATLERLFELVVDPGDALDAFHHPFAYAAFRGIAFDALFAHATRTSRAQGSRA